MKEIYKKLKNDQPDLWDRFTRKEEYQNPIRDMHDRFQYWTSKEREVFRPSVSEYLYHEGLIKPDYPDGCEFALCVTHDIDVVFLSSLISKASITFGHLLYKNWFSAAKLLLSFHDQKKPFYNFDEILALEKVYGITSTWFFQALTIGEPEFSYHIHDVAYVFDNILDAGGEIGLHGGFKASYDEEQLLLEKKRLEDELGKKVTGYRSHYLKFSVPKTWEILSKTGFLFDSTLGYTDCVGFRNGMCHPFRPVNLDTGKEIDIIEIPQILMDITLFGEYMRLDFNLAWNLIKNMIDTIHACHGVFVVNWHNNSYLEGSVELQLLERIFEYSTEKRAYMGTLGDICK